MWKWIYINTLSTHGGCHNQNEVTKQIKLLSLNLLCKMIYKKELTTWPNIVVTNTYKEGSPIEFGKETQRSLKIKL